MTICWYKLSSLIFTPFGSGSEYKIRRLDPDPYGHFWDPGSSVSDPDPDSGGLLDPDPDSGGLLDPDPDSESGSGGFKKGQIC